MLATVVADIVYSAVNDDSLMTEKLRRRGLHVGRHYGVDPFSSARVGEIMTANVISLPSTATVGEARARFAAGGHGAYPIVDEENRLTGIVSRGDILGNDCEDDEPLMSQASTPELVTTSSKAERGDSGLLSGASSRVAYNGCSWICSSRPQGGDGFDTAVNPDSASASWWAWRQAAAEPGNR